MPREYKMSEQPSSGNLGYMQDPAEMIPDDVPELDEEEQARVDEAWKVEITRRIADFRSGKVKPVPWEDAEVRIRAMLDRQRRRK
jgi:putative addiction module component (TIGR02574 family)